MDLCLNIINSLKTCMQSSDLTKIIVTHSPGEFGPNWTIENIVCFRRESVVPTTRNVDSLIYALFDSLESETKLTIKISKEDTAYLHIILDNDNIRLLEKDSE